jgi:excisionase family DNA binding protein
VNLDNINQFGRSNAASILDNRILREWLSTEEAAFYLSISANALRIMVHRGQIRAYKLGRRLRFKQQDCQALFKPKGA